MTSEEYKKAVDFWKAKECKEMLSDQLKLVVEEFLHNSSICNSSICALATETDDYVRCTPLEYSYHDGCFGIFTESGEKFIGLEKNKNVSLAVFEKIHILVS